MFFVFVYHFESIGVRIGIATAWVFRMARRRQSANTLADVPEPLEAGVDMVCELTFFCKADQKTMQALPRRVSTYVGARLELQMCAPSRTSEHGHGDMPGSWPVRGTVQSRKHSFVMP